MLIFIVMLCALSVLTFVIIASQTLVARHLPTVAGLLVTPAVLALTAAWLVYLLTN